MRSREKAPPPHRGSGAQGGLRNRRPGFVGKVGNAVCRRALGPRIRGPRPARSGEAGRVRWSAMQRASPGWSGAGAGCARESPENAPGRSTADPLLAPRPAARNALGSSGPLMLADCVDDPAELAVGLLPRAAPDQPPSGSGRVDASGPRRGIEGRAPAKFVDEHERGGQRQAGWRPTLGTSALHHEPPFVAASTNASTARRIAGGRSGLSIRITPRRRPGARDASAASLSATPGTPRTGQPWAAPSRERSATTGAECRRP